MGDLERVQKQRRILITVSEKTQLTACDRVFGTHSTNSSEQSSQREEPSHWL